MHAQTHTKYVLFPFIFNKNFNCLVNLVNVINVKYLNHIQAFRC